MCYDERVPRRRGEDLWRHRRLPKLQEPRLFNELVQHRKLLGRDVRQSALSDKVRVKALVAERIGPE